MGCLGREIICIQNTKGSVVALKWQRNKNDTSQLRLTGHILPMDTKTGDRSLMKGGWGRGGTCSRCRRRAVTFIDFSARHLPSLGRLGLHGAQLDSLGENHYLIISAIVPQMV